MILRRGFSVVETVLVLVILVTLFIVIGPAYRSTQPRIENGNLVIVDKQGVRFEVPAGSFLRLTERAKCRPDKLKHGLWKIDGFGVGKNGETTASLLGKKWTEGTRHEKLVLAEEELQQQLVRSNIDPVLPGSPEYMPTLDEFENTFSSTEID